MTTPASVTDALLAADHHDHRSRRPDGTEFTGTGYGGLRRVTSRRRRLHGVVWASRTSAPPDNEFIPGKGFGGCDTNKKFENTNFGGSVLTCTPNCTNYGTLSNQVSSLRWKP